MADLVENLLLFLITGGLETVDENSPLRSCNHVTQANVSNDHWESGHWSHFRGLPLAGDFEDIFLKPA